MRLTRFFLNNRRLSLLLFLLLLALGAQALRTIPLSEDPPLEIPRFSVLAVLPGAGPQQIESLLVQPIENSFHELEDVKRLNTAIRNGVAHLEIEFRFGTDPERKFDELVRKVNALRTSLPASLAYLEVLRGQTTNVAILQLAVVGPNEDGLASGLAREALAERLRQRLERVQGVKRAELHAAPKYELRVNLDPNRMRRLSVELEQIVTSIASRSSALPGGQVTIHNQTLSVDSPQQRVDPKSLQTLAIQGNPSGKAPVRLGDIADLSLQPEPLAVSGKFNDQPAVFVVAMMEKEANIFAVTQGLRDAVTDFQKTLPPGVRIETGFDQSLNVNARVSHLARDFLLALLLVLFTLAPLGLRPALLVFISIPLCLALGIAALQWTGFNLNQLSLVGCIIALGLLVDDSIVVVENIARFRREGHPPQEAARHATQQISAAVLGTTATLLLAFLPLLMLPETAGLFIRSLPAAVVYCVAASLFIALTIVPWLACTLLGGPSRPEGNPILRMLQRVISTVYRPALNGCMAHPRLALAGALIFPLLTLCLVPKIGWSLFPKADTPYFLVEFLGPENATRKSLESIVGHIESALLAEQSVQSCSTTIGAGNPRVFYNVFPPPPANNLATILVALKPESPSKRASLLKRLQAKAAQMDGTRIVIREFQNGPPVEAPIEVRVYGSKPDTQRVFASQVESVLRQIPGVETVSSPSLTERGEILAVPSDDKIAALGLPRKAAQQLIRLAMAGLDAGKWRTEENLERHIRVHVPSPELKAVADLESIQVPLRPGIWAPLASFARFDTVSAPSVLEHRDRERIFTIRAQVRDGENVDRLSKELRHRLEKLERPPGCQWELGGEWESRIESFSGFGKAILTAIFGILAVLVFEFGDFRSLLIVASVIPQGIAGGLLGLWIAGYSLSFTATVGFIALIGIEIKNSILLVDFTNQLRSQGVGLNEAIARAGEIRFLPVVLTTLTALGALIPLALERSGLYSPLAIVIIGGSVSSLLLSRLVTPVLYRLIPPDLPLNSHPPPPSFPTTTPVPA